MPKTYKLLIWLAIYAVAMGFLESAVVVYLRKIYYPDGFGFPLRTLDPVIAVAEFLREAATMIMLVTLALITFRQAICRFAVFIYAFAIWDIFYYVFLWVLLTWPPTLLTWDILFLIPVTWVGPVLAPVINSLTMIVLAILLIYYKVRNDLFRLSFMEWFFFILGALVIIFAYTRPYMQYMLAKYRLTDLLSVSRNKEFLDYSCLFVPQHFNWMLFVLGELFILFPIFQIIFRMRPK